MKRVWARAPVPLALMVLIFYLSAQPSVGPELPAFTRVIAHFFEYAVLAGLWLWALTPGLGRRAIGAAAVISLTYAVSDEFHQGFVAGRHADPLDVLADAAGIAAVVLVARRRGAREPSSRRTSI